MFAGEGFEVRGVKAYAVVADGEGKAVLFAEADFDAAGAGVFADVGQALL